jgi:pimeloyl-ACP methyl ester carboxylesterase
VSDATVPPFSIYGGVGGERAVTDDLERGAAVLLRAAEELREAGKALRAAAWHAEDAYPRALPEVAPYVYDAKEASWDALQGRHSAVTLERELDDVAQRLREVREAFLSAEHAAHRGVTRLSSMGRSAGDLAAAWAWWARTTTGELVRRAGPGGLAEWIDPEYALPTSGVLNRTSVEDHLGALQAAGIFTPIRLGLLLAARITELLLSEQRLVDVRPERVHDASPIASLSDLGRVLEELNGTYPREVVVDRIIDEDGNELWIVVVPGTGEWVGPDGEVIDLVSDLQNQDGSMSDATAMVLAAMEEAGVGPDDPVMMAGHSAGGMIASAIAAHPQRPYSVKAVVTVGSPVGDIPHIPGVASLHIENEADLVPSLDGLSNPDLPNVVTARFDSRTFAERTDLPDSRTITGAHNPRVYTEAMELLEKNKSASMTAWHEQTAQFFDEDATVERTVMHQVHGPAEAPAERAREPRPEPTFELPQISLGGIPELRPPSRAQLELPHISLGGIPELRP